MIYKRLVIGIILIYLCWASVCCAATDDFQIKALKGLPGIMVLVEQLNSKIENVGITREILKTDTELRLRKAGIKVMPESSGGFLYIYINTLEIKFRGVASHIIYTINIMFTETAKLEREPPIDALVITWHNNGYLGIVPSREAREEIRNRLGDKVDGFINDYLAANPKK